MKLKFNWEIPYNHGEVIVDFEDDLGVSEEEWDNLEDYKRVDLLEIYATQDLNLLTFADPTSWEKINE